MSGIRIRPKSERKAPVWRREWGCPLTRNRSPWCFAICTPQDGHGDCGRIAPHTLLGRTQLAILRHDPERGGEGEAGEG
jgi:hypothetical protein